jgi:hypothetical protein
MADDGLWIQSVVADGDLLSDSHRNDGVIRTEARDTRILFGFSNAVSSTLILSSLGASVAGNLTVDGGKLQLGNLDVQAEFQSVTERIDRLQSEPAADDSVRSNAIAESNVSADKISGILPVSVGGTGISSVASGAIPFGGATGGSLDTHLSLSFDSNTETLAAINASVEGRLHAFQDAIIGAPGDVRYRFRVDTNDDRDLIMTRIEQDGTDSEYINFRDITNLLNNVGIT